jgi:Arc/MetJ-type ribon-helix-helix transcriptional regulator
VNVKLPEQQLQRLDAAIAQGRVANRSEALRLGLDHVLREWDRAAWDERWEAVIPTDVDEFADLAASAGSDWGSLDEEQ